VVAAEGVRGEADLIDELGGVVAGVAASGGALVCGEQLGHTVVTQELVDEAQ